jgi:hypothetical protein
VKWLPLEPRSQWKLSFIVRLMDLCRLLPPEYLFLPFALSHFAYLLSIQSDGTSIKRVEATDIDIDINDNNKRCHCLTPPTTTTATIAR